MSPEPLVSDGDPIAPLVEDFLERLRRGERPDVAGYVARYPEHAGRIAELLPALELMERLKPGPDTRTVTADARPAAAPADGGEGPRRLGDYLILRELGRGGMGVVYEAVQESLGRHVALKVLPGYALPGSAQRERFRLEARSVARLHHTNIVPVFAVGEHEGVPYYAMQFIAGQSLQVVLDDLRRLRPGPAGAAGEAATVIDGAPSIARSLLSGQFAARPGPAAGAGTADPTAPAAAPSPGLSGADRRGYFGAVARVGLQVAEALAHAHDRGVLHRDIKPSNLLLDPDGRAWVTDFGLAKLEGADGPTRTGDVVGTLRYMAPERFEGRSDPRSDVYALGATLYELLTLRPVFDVASRSALVERVLHAEPVAPRALDPRVPRDLETVILKAMAKAPSDRYASAAALAGDLRRFLEDRPIRARRAGRAERAWRWCRRNPAVAGLLGGVIASLAAGTAISATLAVRARQAEHDATDDRDRAIKSEGRAVANLKRAQREEARAKAKEAEAQAVLKFFRDRVLAAARPKDQEGGLGVDVTLRAALDAAEASIATDLNDQPLVEAAVRDTLGTSYLYLRVPELAIRQHERARAIVLAELGPDHPDTLASMSNLALAYRDAGRLDEAIALQAEALRLERAMLGPDHPHTLISMSNLAVAYGAAGRLDEAIALQAEALKHQKAKLGPDHPDTLSSINNLALAYRIAGRRDEAVALHAEAWKLQKTKLGPDHPDTLTGMNNLAVAYFDAGRLDDALPLLGEALNLRKAKLGPDHPDTLNSMHNLAAVYRVAGRFDEAIALHEEALKLQKAKLGPDHPETLISMSNLAAEYRDAGRAADALPLFKEVQKLQKAKLGPDHPDTLISMNELAVAYHDAGRLDAAIALHEEALKLQKAKLGPDHPHTLISMSNLAWAYRDAGRLDEAIALHAEALKLQKAKLGPDHPDTLIGRNSLAASYLIAKRWAEAETTARECLELRTARRPDDWWRFHTMSQLGAALAGQAKYAEAEPLLIEGYEGLKARRDKIPAPLRKFVAAAAARIVPLYEAWGKPEEAARWRARLGAPGGEAEPRS